LKTKRHVEILRNVRFGPELVVSILVLVADLLNSGPTEDGIVTDEWSNITVGDGVTNGSVDEVGEESDTLEMSVNVRRKDGCGVLTYPFSK
jgi:hypothetical protein